jgi:hypothetical protein
MVVTDYRQSGWYCERIMTMVVALGNIQDAILVSDRRLTMPNGSHNDESNKAFVLVTRDARMAIGFAGIAEAPSLGFRTRFWLPQALAEAAPPDHSIAGMMERLKARAERDISPLHLKDKRLSITGVGYIYDNGSPRLAFFRLSNFESAEMLPKVSNSADSEFHLWEWIAHDHEPSAQLRHISGWHHLPASAGKTWEEICDWVGSRKPWRAIVSRTVKLIRLTADAHQTHGMVGRQCMSIVIPSDPSLAPVALYHTSTVKSAAYMPGHIEARGGSFGVFATADLEFGPANKKDPFVTPQVPRNRPCPCGNGKKFKYCHGRNPKGR